MFRSGLHLITVDRQLGYWGGPASPLLPHSPHTTAGFPRSLSGIERPMIAPFFAGMPPVGRPAIFCKMAFPLAPESA